jgi:hypothetical protein
MNCNQLQHKIICQKNYLIHQMVVIIAMMQVVISATLLYAGPLYDKTPYHTSALTGIDWVHKLIKGHPEHIHNELGVHKHVFHKFIEELQASHYVATRHVTLDGQLAIVLYTCVIGLSI